MPLKYYRGQTQGIVDQNVIEKRRQLENEFQQWVKQRPNRQQTYGDALNLIQRAHDSIQIYNTASTYNRITRYLIEIVSFAGSFTQFPMLLGNAEMGREKIIQTLQQFQPAIEEFYDDYNPPTDQKVFAALFRLYSENVPEQFHPDFLKDVQDFDQWASTVFESSIFADRERLIGFLNDPELEVLQRDTVFQISQQFNNHIIQIRNRTTDAQADLDRGNRLFVRGLMEMHPDRHFYPDANSTMRVTYGTIQGYRPADAVIYEHYTTMEGLVAKHQPEDEEFDVPQKLLDLIDNREFGAYGNHDTLKLNFTANTDITGGNSGSPVLNARGELIGVAFDGNWEAMSSDIAYIPELQRTISVDIRYVLFVIDKFAEARHLLDEMDIVGEETPAPTRQERRRQRTR
jgi:hypothetical protein